MSPRTHSSCTCLYTALFLSASAALAPAQNADVRPALPPESALERARTEPLPESAFDLRRNEVLFDERTSGVLWASGVAYKARFDGARVKYVPHLGESAPRNFPLEMSVGGFTRGAAAVPFEPGTMLARAGTTVRIDHGSFVEEYVLGTQSMEQRFVLAALPAGTGDLSLRIRVETELEGEDVGDSLRFTGTFARVDYGAAFAIDARGRRIALDSTWDGANIELTVPESFLQTAALPLTIDPLVTSWDVGGSGAGDMGPDVAYDVGTGRYCVVWTDTLAGGDHDAFARLYSSTGAIVGSYALDVSDLIDWQSSRVANNNGSNTFLVVAGVSTQGAPYVIRGQIIDAAGGTHPSFIISTTLVGDQRLPDVGGDPYAGTNSYFCVTWQHDNQSVTDSDVLARLVSGSGSPVGSAPISVAVSTILDANPRISESCGKASANTESWTIAWRRRVTLLNNDIWGAQIRWNGGIVHAAFPIETGTGNDILPKPATLLDDNGSGQERPYMVVFQHQASLNFQQDVIGKALRGATVIDSRNLSSTFESTWAALDQFNCTAASDGAQFLVGYGERLNASSTNFDAYASGYYLSGDQIVPCQVHQLLEGSLSSEGLVALASQADGGGLGQRYIAAWNSYVGSGYGDCHAGLFDGCVGGTVQSYCAGDGTGTACPCGNNGAANHGCASSANVLGAQLTVTGLAIVSNDTLSLRASGMPTTTSCLFFQGTDDANNGAGLPFGDGKRCATGTIRRLGNKTTTSGVAVYPGLSDASVSVRGLLPAEGGTRYYQVWYRNAATFCTSSTFNLTNGVQVVWSL